MKSARREISCCTEGKGHWTRGKVMRKKMRSEKDNNSKKKANLLALPALKWPARLLLYLAFLALAAAAIYQAAYGILPEMAGGAVYAGAAVLLICAGVYLYRDIRAGVRKVTAKIEANALTRRLYRDSDPFRMVHDHGRLLLSAWRNAASVGEQ